MDDKISLYKSQYNQYQFKVIQNLYPKEKNLISAACNYAMDTPGKRIRPLLLILCCESLEGNRESCFPAALALEMVHTYSLVHDDLPCMDNDDMRRGRPTVHVKFNQATAVLVGDALLSDSFAVLTGSPYNSQLIVDIIQDFSQAIGSQGMVNGQCLDMEKEGMNHSGLQAKDLDLIHKNKTGKLIATACKIGAMIASPQDPEIAKYYYQFGLNLGLAFQIKDDIIDDHSGTGKSTSKDLAAGKLTYLSLLGREHATEACSYYTDKALQYLKKSPGDTRFLQEFSYYLLDRKN